MKSDLGRTLEEISSLSWPSTFRAVVKTYSLDSHNRLRRVRLRLGGGSDRNDPQDDEKRPKGDADAAILTRKAVEDGEALSANGSDPRVA